MKFLIPVFLSAMLLSCSEQDAYNEISLEDYQDKMKGAWIGQMAGVGWGLPTEFKFIDRKIPEERVPEWTTEMINQQGNDDLYVEMTFLASMEKYGTDVSIRQAGIDFANSGYGLWAANKSGRANLRFGIAPPESSHPFYNFNCEDIDYQIEADYSGIIAPGMPQVAIELGEKFGRLMNYGDGLYGGQFVGGMYAAAYFTNDIPGIISAGLDCIPQESNYAKCIRDVIAWHDQYPENWEKCWDEIMEKYYRTLEYQPFHKQNRDAWVGIDAKINGAFIVLGLLYGEGDMDQTIIYSMRCGLDSDCNPSNAAGILATTIGFKNLDYKYKVGLDETKKFSYTDYDFTDLLRVSESFAREFVIKNEGKIKKDQEGKDYFLIKKKEIIPSKFEPAYSPGAYDPENRYTEQEMLEILAYSYKEYLPVLEDVARGWKVYHAGKGSSLELLEFEQKEQVLVLSPMSHSRSVLLEYTLEKVDVNDEGVGQNNHEATSGILTFFLNAEEDKPWNMSLRITSQPEKILIEESITHSKGGAWKKFEIPFVISDGKIPKIYMEVKSLTGGELNLAYISNLNVAFKSSPL